MTLQIAFIGAGGIGARHLQGLARLDHPVIADVVDPRLEARERAGQLLAEVGGLKDGIVRFHATIDAVPSRPDIAIVSTSARERLDAIAATLAIGARTLILEKVLFTRLADYDRCATLLREAGVDVWVNSVRRAYPRAGDLVRLVAGRPFTYRVEGRGWGLGCNLIHHLDEVAMLCGHDDIELSAGSLEGGTIPAKRAGYVEFVGTVTGTSPDGSRIIARCEAGDPGDRVVRIETDGLVATISQTRQSMMIEDGQGRRTEPYPIPFQSVMTAAHISAISSGKAPSLPGYAASARLHRSMLSAFLAHLRRSSTNSDIDECPIT